VTPNRAIADCRLYLCTPDRPDLAGFVAACIAGGVDIVQLREKRLEAGPLLERARVVRDVCTSAGVPFILNDRPDLALGVEADGVHVGQDDAPVDLARRILGPDRIVGLSTHGEDDLTGALGADVSYISAGPVEATPTKPGRASTGLGYLRLARLRHGRGHPGAGSGPGRGRRPALRGGAIPDRSLGSVGRGAAPA